MKRVQRPALEPDGIVRTALDVLDEVGLDELSMRRLADALGVQNPALYWHVRNKQELLDRMAHVLLTEGFALAEAEGPEPRSWKKKLERFARALRDALRSRKDGARLVAAADMSQPDSAFLVRIEALVPALVADGFRTVDAFGSVLTLIHYTIGATLEEQSDPRGGEPAIPSEGISPAFAAVKAAMEREMAGRSRVDARFELGISLIIDGLQARRVRAKSDAR